MSSRYTDNGVRLDMAVISSRKDYVIKQCLSTYYAPDWGQGAENTKMDT